MPGEGTSAGVSIPMKPSSAKNWRIPWMIWKRRIKLFLIFSFKNPTSPLLYLCFEIAVSALMLTASPHQNSIMAEALFPLGKMATQGDYYELTHLDHLPISW
jgi:hypothetical protein